MDKTFAIIGPTLFSLLPLQIIHYTEQILAYTCTGGSNGISLNNIQSIFVICHHIRHKLSTNSPFSPRSTLNLNIIL